MCRYDVTAVLVTRGDVDLRPILDSLPFNDVIVWDNSNRFNFKVFGRFRAALEAKNDIIYTQDDDCIVEAEKVVAAYESGKVTCNMSARKRAEYEGLGLGRIALVGWGAVFDRELISVLQRYLDRWPLDDLFLRECDRIFTALNELKMIDVPFCHLPHATAPDRMAGEARHLADLMEVRKRIEAL